MNQFYLLVNFGILEIGQLARQPISKEWICKWWPQTICLSSSFLADPWPVPYPASAPTTGGGPHNSQKTPRQRSPPRTHTNALRGKNTRRVPHSAQSMEEAPGDTQQPPARRSLIKRSQTERPCNSAPGFTNLVSSQALTFHRLSVPSIPLHRLNYWQM